MSSQPFENLSPQEFADKMKADDSAVLLDVRTPGEVAESYIPGAQFADINDAAFPDKIAELDKSKNYYVYCRAGGRSARALMMMAQEGFEGQLFNLDGGITAWDGDLKTDG